MHERWVVRTKLLSPQLPRPLLHRPHLHSLLAAGRPVPLVLVQAAAGYGKSTALAAFVAERSEPAAWYTLSDSDSDPLLFVAHMIAATDALVSGVETELQPLVVQARRGDLPWSVVCDSLNNMLLEQMTDDGWLVLDDLHVLAGASDVLELLDRFLNHAPPRLHVVVSTRHRLELPALTQALARGTAHHLSERDLALTADEIVTLFREHHSIALTDQQAGALHRETEGWIIAVRLLAHQLQDAPPEQIDEALDDLPGRLDTLFDFLTQSVIRRQPPDVQTFLTRTAILRQLEPAACDAVRRTDDSTAMLRRLRDTGLSLIQVDAQTYRHHHLVHEFLQRQLRSDRRQWRTLHRRAAAHFAATGRSEESIHHLLEAQDFEAAAHHLSMVADQLLQAGRFGTLAGWFDRLPESLMNEWPDLYVVQGDVARLTSRYEDALTIYQRAEAIYAEQNDALGRSHALEGQGLVYVDTVRPAQAETYLKQALKALGRQHRAESGRLLRLLAENATNRGRPALAARWYEAARGFDAQTNLELEIRIHLRSGRLDEARALLVPTLDESDHRRPARTHREPSLLLSLIQALQGDTLEARRGAADGLRLARRLQSPFTEAVAHMRLGHAWQLPPRPDIPRARDHYLRALRQVRRLGVSRGEAEPLFGLTLLYTFDGMPQAAEDAAARGLRIAQAAGDGWVAGLLQLALGITRSRHADLPDARETLGDALQQLRECDDVHGVTVAHMWMTWLAHLYDDADLFAAHAKQWLAHAEQYPQHVSQPTLFGFRDAQVAIPLLIAARTRGHRSDVAARLLEQLGLLADIRYHPGYSLRIETLGGFQIWRGGDLIDDSEWQRAKARDLFKLFLINRGQLLQREQYIEWLCPDLDLETGENHFKVALSALTRTLEPARPRGEASFFIERHGTCYGLNPAAAIDVDVDHFEAGIARAEALADDDPERAIDTYQRALNVYDGAFLPACRYEDWAIRIRERLRMRFLYAAEALAHLLLTHSRADEAITWCERILDVDPCWEPAYRIAMRGHVAIGQRHLAGRIYERCVEALERELDLAPMPETTQLYNTLVRVPSPV